MIKHSALSPAYFRPLQAKKFREESGVSASTLVTGSKAIIGPIQEDEKVLPNHPVSVDAGAALDLEYIRSLCTLERRFWSEIHAPGAVSAGGVAVYALLSGSWLV